MVAPASTSTLPSKPSDRSLSELLHDLSGGTAQLVRQEIRLARTETAESLHQLGGGVAQLAGGMVLATCALGAAVAGIILLLSRYVLNGATWLAALVVAVVLALVAGLCVRNGLRALSPSTLVPDETTTSIKETAAWLKHPTTSAASSR